MTKLFPEKDIGITSKYLQRFYFTKNYADQNPR